MTRNLFSHKEDGESDIDAFSPTGYERDPFETEEKHTERLEDYEGFYND